MTCSKQRYLAKIKQRYLALTVLAHPCLDQPEGVICNSSVFVSVDLKRNAGIILK